MGALGFAPIARMYRSNPCRKKMEITWISCLPLLVAEIQVSRGMKTMERAPRHRPSVSDHDGGTFSFKNEDLFRVIVLMKWDCLPWRQGLGKDKKVLRVPVFAVNLDGEWQAAQRTGGVD